MVITLLDDSSMCFTLNINSKHKKRNQNVDRFMFLLMDLVELSLSHTSISKQKWFTACMSQTKIEFYPETKRPFYWTQKIFDFVLRMQVFDDVAIELTMALLQFFNAKPSEEHLFRTLKALGKFVTVSTTVRDCWDTNIYLIKNMQLPRRYHLIYHNWCKWLVRIQVHLKERVRESMKLLRKFRKKFAEHLWMEKA